MSDLGDPVPLARALVRCPSVTPEDAGALELLADALAELGFSVHRLRFHDREGAAVDNLYARVGTSGPNFCFAGHTDVVPTGDPAAWTYPPFAADLVDGALWGRGAADMKGAIAAFVAAAARRLRAGAPRGSISLLITGDEEGPAINGTRKVLDWLAARGERIDHCLVGEPTSSEALGDMMKVGRRGSMNCVLTAHGAQGHVAYPDRARNPVHALNRLIAALIEEPLDAGFDRFPPSSLQVTDLEVGNRAHNVIPAAARARFNVRFNPIWTGARLEAEIRSRLSAAAAAAGVDFALDVVISGEAFLSTDDAFIDLVSRCVARRTGREPERSTSGGTSDARFIRAFAPVAEFGLVGRTIHQIDERAATADIQALADIYEDILAAYFAPGSST